MTLDESDEVGGLDFDDGSFIDFTGADVITANQLPQPCGGGGVVFVVVGERFRHAIATRAAPSSMTMPTFPDESTRSIHA